MTIQRYEMDWDQDFRGRINPFLSPNDKGDAVHYTDHLAAIAEKDKENNRLMNQLAVLVADNARFRGVLEFYADYDNYIVIAGMHCKAQIECGVLARKALKEVKG